MTGNVLVDLRNMYPQALAEEAGLVYYGIGRTPRQLSATPRLGAAHTRPRAGILRCPPAQCHVWTAPHWQVKTSRRSVDRLQPCVRPVDAVHMTAGHNALRLLVSLERCQAKIRRSNSRICAFNIRSCAPRAARHARATSGTRWGGAGLDPNQAWRQLLEERQNVAALQLTADEHIAFRADAVHLKNRLCNVETDGCDRLHDWLLRIVGALTAPTSMA